MPQLHRYVISTNELTGKLVIILRVWSIAIRSGWDRRLAGKPTFFPPVRFERRGATASVLRAVVNIECRFSAMPFSRRCEAQLQGGYLPSHKGMPAHCSFSHLTMRPR